MPSGFGFEFLCPRVRFLLSSYSFLAYKSFLYARSTARNARCAQLPNAQSQFLVFLQSCSLVSFYSPFLHTESTMTLKVQQRMNVFGFYNHCTTTRWHSLFHNNAAELYKKFVFGKHAETNCMVFIHVDWTSVFRWGQNSYQIQIIWTGND